MTKNTKKASTPRRSTASKPDRADPVERAIAEVGRLNSQELGMAVLYQHRAAELASVRAERGDQVLDADDPTGAARLSGRLVAEKLEELESLADASKRARERRLAAIPAVFKAQADVADRAAAQLEKEANELEVRSTELRKALEDHDGCAYQPAPPSAPERMIGGQVGGAPTVIVYRAPRFELLRLAAADKRAEAGKHRLKQPHQAGAVEADDRDALLEVVFSDPMRVGPPINAIRTWADQAVEKERRRRERVSGGSDFVPDGAPYRLHLEWLGGAIDQAASGVVRLAAPEVSAHFDSAAEMAQVGGALADGALEVALEEA